MYQFTERLKGEQPTKVEENVYVYMYVIPSLLITFSDTFNCFTLLVCTYYF